VTANGTSTSTITVTLKDWSGNPVSGKTVSLAAGSGSSTITTVSGTTNSSGQATFTVTDTTPQIVTYTATDTTDSVTVTQTASVTFIYSTQVTFRSFSATSQEGGILLQWRTGREVSNLGFHLYRDGVRITRSPIAGSALLAGASTVLTAGNSYTWFDPQGTPSSSYTLEDLDLNGTKTMHGSFPVTSSSASAAGAAALRSVSPLLSQVGRTPIASGLSFTTAAIDPQTELPEARRPLPSADAANRQFTLAAGQAVTLGVQQEGWYHVDASQLTAAGMPAGVNPGSLQLFVEGQEQAMVVEGSGQVSAIEFYGTGLDTTFSGTRVYWLTWGGNAGSRVQSNNRQQAGGEAPGSFPADVQWQPRTVYFAALLNGDADNFFGPTINSTDPVAQPLTLNHLSTTTTGASTLTVTLQGVNLGSHNVSLQLNGSQIGSLSFNDQANYTSSFPVSNSLLVEGANNLVLTTANPEDVTLVDTVLLSYPHTYTADNDYLRLSTASGAPVTIGGFSNNQIQVMDITDPYRVESLAGTIAQQGTTYSISVTVRGGSRTLLAFTNAQKSQPASITAHHPSSWHTAQAGADMVIISHADFIPSLAPLEALRQSQGHTVAIIDVQDAYGEFNFGEQSPYAIKALLSTANTTWTTKPHWVLLVGDATFDPHNYLGTGQVDYLPVELIDTTSLETSSDDWFADFNNDGIPQLAVGRLPVDTPAIATALVGKIVAYDKAGAAAWKSSALLVSGTNDSADPFDTYTAAVQALLPSSVTVTKIQQSSDANAATDLMTAMNSGQGLVNFVGHGSTEVWEGGLFDSTAATSLTNGAATPFVISMTCLNGYFQDVYTFGLAKALLEAPGGGAVGVWASSTLTNSAPQATLNQSAVAALFGSTPMTVGDAAVAAKKTITDSDVQRTWILFGDPAMKLQ
jgi:hypothetical protein